MLLRRTRLGLVDAVALRDEAPRRAVAEVMAGELGWSPGRVDEEVAGWDAVAAREGLDPAASVAQSSS